MIRKITSVVLMCIFITLSQANYCFAHSGFPVATPGLATIKNFLQTALLPVGRTMYIWGGGWNKEDTGSGEGSVHIGLMPSWETFHNEQNSTYNFRSYLYHINKGLDCSGFVGWTLYNIFNTENGHEGYVMPARKMAYEFAEREFGTYKDKNSIIDYKPGDIMSSKGHVYICMGQCRDDSLVLIHSSPCGVQINGTVTPQGDEDSIAISLAKHYMNKYYPEWSEKFPEFSRGINYLNEFSQMRWNVDDSGVVFDPDDYFNKDIETILKDLFNEEIL